MRYIRAFFTTLKIMLRGEQTPEPANAALRRWVDETVKQVDSVLKIADQNGLAVEQRKKITLKLDGRNMSMETVLTAVRYHATEEYPHLLQHVSRHTITAIYASNLNDRYRVSQLKDILESIPVKDAVTRLSIHLDNIPPTI